MSDRPGYDPMDRQSIRDRVFSDAHKSAEGGGASVAAAFFAVSMFLLIGFYSIRQITDQNTAFHIISEGIRATTGVDQLLDEHLNAVRLAAATAQPDELVSIPDYPLPVNLQPSEVRELSDAELRELVLARSAGMVYSEGLTPFDQTGLQSFGFLSVEGMLDQLLGGLTGSTHKRAGYAAAVLLAVVTASGAAVLALNPGFRRFRAFGLAALLSSLPGYFGAWGMGFLLSQIGSSDPYWVDLRALSDAMLDVTQRNFLIVGVLGAVIAVMAVLFEVGARFLPDQPPRAERERPAPPAPEVDQLIAGEHSEL